MCEPSHSIVQYPEDRGDGNPTEPLLESSVRKKILELGKRFWKWLHFSKLGTGHWQAIRTLGSYTSFIPQETRYEAYWWDRTVKLDGKFYGEAFDKEQALAAALNYAKAVSIGSLTALRRFLETSLRKSDRVHLYTTAFLEKMLNKEGRDLATRRLRSCNVDLTYIRKVLGWHYDNKGLDSIIKVLLGMTRQRSLLNDAWADDSSLWTPGQPQIEVTQQPTGIVFP